MAEKITFGRINNYEEFDKIVYILVTLNFFHFLGEFWKEFFPRFEELEAKDNRIESVATEVMKYERWLKDFCNDAPNDEVRDILKEIFEIDNLNSRRFIYFPDGTIL